MVEVVKDAELFHQARDEIERRFAILHAIFELRITILETEPKILEVKEIKHLTDDVRHGQVLKNPAVGLAGQKPEPGDDLSAVVGEYPRVGFALRKTADVSADVARRAVGKMKSNRDFLADNIRERNGIVLEGEKIQFIAEQTRNSFVPRQLLQQENILPQRSVDGNQPVILTKAFVWHVPVLPWFLQRRSIASACGTSAFRGRPNY